MFTRVLTGRWRYSHFHGWSDLFSSGLANLTEGCLMKVKQEPAKNVSEVLASSGYGSPLSPSTRLRGTLPACCVATSFNGPQKEVIVPMTVRLQVPEGHCDPPPRKSPFLKQLVRTTSVLDDASKKEWADDVEFRLRKVIKTLELKGACYDVERSGNAVLISTVSPMELTKQQIAALSAGRWLGWAEILDAVPELTRSIVEFDAINRGEWCRRWDIEDAEPRA